MTRRIREIAAWSATGAIACFARAPQSGLVLAAIALALCLEPISSGAYAAKRDVGRPALQSGDDPEMVTIGPGEFTMGSADHGPAHQVRIGYAFAVSKYPITVAEFGRFVRETGYDTGSHCWTHVGAVVHDTLTEGDWRDPQFPQHGNNPVVCISWNEAQAYAVWLSKKTSQAYRLPTEAEYEYINRAGTTTAYWWGDAVGTGHANCNACGSAWDNKGTSPVGSFSPNPFGLYDTTGNVWEWTADCWHDTYTGAPSDGSATTNGDCVRRSIRGGSFGHDPLALRASERYGIAPDVHDQHLGFRLAKSLFPRDLGLQR